LVRANQLSFRIPTKFSGLGFKTPKEAINGTYIDKKCPFTGNKCKKKQIAEAIQAMSAFVAVFSEELLSPQR
jgi:hypothetical protein